MYYLTYKYYGILTAKIYYTYEEAYHDYNVLKGVVPVHFNFDDFSVCH